MVWTTVNNGIDTLTNWTGLMAGDKKDSTSNPYLDWLNDMRVTFYEEADYGNDAGWTGVGSGVNVSTTFPGTPSNGVSFLRKNTNGASGETRLYVYEGTWIYRTISDAVTTTTLDDLTDVVITSVADNEILQYDNASAKWINQTFTEADIPTKTYVDSLDHHTIFSPGTAVNDHSDITNAGSGSIISTSERTGLHTTHSYKTDLDSLNDVVITTPADGALLRYNDSVSEWQDYLIPLDLLSNVEIVSISDNEILQYNPTGTKWENQTLAEAGISANPHGSADHNVGTPSNVGTANAQGSSANVPRLDHVHAHPSGLGASLHHAKYLDASAVSAVQNTGLLMASAKTIGFALGTTANEFSIDGTFGGNSDDAVPTEKAVKTYTDTRTNILYAMNKFATLGAIIFSGLTGTTSPLQGADYFPASDADCGIHYMFILPSWYGGESITFKCIWTSDGSSGTYTAVINVNATQADGTEVLSNTNDSTGWNVALNQTFNFAISGTTFRLRTNTYSIGAQTAGDFIQVFIESTTSNSNWVGIKMAWIEW